MNWFKFETSEPVRDRIVRCCTAALAAGPMGERERGEFYAKFINCGMEPAGFVGKAPVKSIASWRTSCALFARAVMYWCGKPTKAAVNGAGVFQYLGDLSYQHPAWVRNEGGKLPNPGDVFYIADNLASNNNHVGIFLAHMGDGVFQTAEGGGGDGTRCSFGKRTISNVVKFDRFNRKLLGWFDCEKLGMPFESAAVPELEPVKEEPAPEPEPMQQPHVADVIPINSTVEIKPPAKPWDSGKAIGAAVLVVCGLLIALIEKAC